MTSSDLAEEFLIQQKTKRGCASWCIEQARGGYQAFLCSIFESLQDEDALVAAGLHGNVAFLLPEEHQVHLFKVLFWFR